MNKLNVELNKWIEKNKDEILKNISQLIQIETVNTPPTGNEKPGQEFLYNLISEFIPKKDIDVFEVDDVNNIREHPLFESRIEGIERIYKNRPNLVIKLKGSSGEFKKNIVFSGHMDTAQIKEESWKVFKDPLSGKIKENKIYGRGVLDMKAGTLAGFYVLKCLKELNIKLKGDVFAESVVDEEYGGVNGTIACRLRNPNISFAILAEPSQLCCGIETWAGSVFKLLLKNEGPGGYYQKTDVIYKMAKIVSILKEYDKNRRKNINFPEYYNENDTIPLSFFSFYSGGKDYIENGSYIPNESSLIFYLPVLSYISENNLIRDLDKYIKKAIYSDIDFKNINYDIKKVIRWMKGHKTDLNQKGMHSVSKAYQIMNIPCVQKGLDFCCDAFAFKEISNTNVVVIGPKGENYHGMDEYVEVESIFNLIKIMVLTAIDFCN